MNFIAGFLYLFLQDEALSFAVLREIINQFELSTLFNTELPMLKLNFYRLDRLISILLPDLHGHFKEESVNSSYFSSSYFITLFTQMMQFQTTNDNMWKILRIWDYFIIHGWKAIFKASVLILTEFEESLLGMNFEMMLTQIQHLPHRFLVMEDPIKFESPEQKEEFIQNELKNLDKQMQKMTVPTILLERLKKEFDETEAMK